MKQTTTLAIFILGLTPGSIRAADGAETGGSLGLQWDSSDPRSSGLVGECDLWWQAAEALTLSLTGRWIPDSRVDRRDQWQAGLLAEWTAWESPAGASFSLAAGMEAPALRNNRGADLLCLARFELPLDDTAGPMSLSLLLGASVTTHPLPGHRQGYWFAGADVRLALPDLGPFSPALVAGVDVESSETFSPTYFVRFSAGLTLNLSEHWTAEVRAGADVSTPYGETGPFAAAGLTWLF